MLNTKEEFPMGFRFLFILNFFLLHQVSLAQQEPSEEDILEGFEDDKDPKDLKQEKISPAKETIPSKNYFDYKIKISLATGYNFLNKNSSTDPSDHRGLSALKPAVSFVTNVYLPFRWKLYLDSSAFYDLKFDLYNENKYTRDYKESMHKEILLGEAYLLGSLGDSFDLKIGRQVILWGIFDFGDTLNVVTALDLRTFGLQNLDTLRLPQTALKLIYSYKSFEASPVVIFEPRVHKTPVYGSEFVSPSIKTSLPQNDKPQPSVDNLQAGFEIKYSGKKFDTTLNYGNIFQKEPYLDLSTPDKPKRNYTKYSLIGGSLSYLVGSFILKSELAYKDGLKKKTNSPLLKRLDSVIGFEYTKGSTLSLNLELSYKYILNYSDIKDSLSDLKEHKIQVLAMGQWNFLRQLYHLKGAFFLFGTSLTDGHMESVSLKYDIADAWAVEGGVLLYTKGEQLDIYEDNDRIFLSCEYSF